jgi:hypothetical protein
MASVFEHVLVPRDRRDMEWLKEALQTAVELEHATLPLYLAAMFSLEVQNYTSYNLIRSVVMEEMVHMSISSNILAALGGIPRIKDLQPVAPGKGLPGGAEPDLVVVFAQLSKRQLKNFMRLELPQFLLPAQYADERTPTISVLYNAIVDCIEDNADAVRAAMQAGGSANQVGDNIGFTTIVYSEDTNPVEQLKAAISEIIEQGEGSSSETLHATDFEGEESHYAKYAELFYGARYQLPEPPIALTRDSEPEFFKGYPITWPKVTNVLAVPGDGYAKILALDPARADVEAALKVFDDKYTEIMTLLDLMWNGPADQSWPNFGKAVAGMTALRVLSCFDINRYEVPAGIIDQLRSLYPDEHEYLSDYTDLGSKVFYGPRFINNNGSTQASLAAEVKQ